jgi:polysaccharide export outer membrane protein
LYPSSVKKSDPRACSVRFGVRFGLRATVLLALLGVTACSSTGAFVWLHDLPAAEWGTQTGEYVIGVGDTVNIRVYDQETLTTRGKIRSDGRLALPFIGDVLVAGKHPSEVGHEVEERLKAFIVSPRVTVNIEDSLPVSVTVMGEVAHKGLITLPTSPGLLQALALSGGLSDYADKSKIFVLRQFPVFRRIRFTYDSLVRNEGRAATFSLRAGDVIVVE